MDTSNGQLNAVTMESINGNEPTSSAIDNNDSSNNIACLGNPDLHCCNELFSPSTQDAGLSNINSKTGCKNSRKPQKTHLDKDTGVLYRI